LIKIKSELSLRSDEIEKISCQFSAWGHSFQVILAELPFEGKFENLWISVCRFPSRGRSFQAKRVFRKGENGVKGCWSWLLWDVCLYLAGCQSGGHNFQAIVTKLGSIIPLSSLTPWHEQRFIEGYLNWGKKSVTNYSQLHKKVRLILDIPDRSNKMAKGANN